MRGALAIAVVATLGSLAQGQVVLPPNIGLPAGASTVPGPGYDMTLGALAAGDYAAALDLAEGEYRGGVKIGADRWIDSIASSALLGECLFEAGRYREAVGRYEESLVLSAAQANWLLSVRFPPQPPQPLRRPRVATWGRSERNAQPSIVPDTTTIRQQGADPQDVLQRGGVLASTYDRTIRPQEVMRSLVIALYRMGSLLGELGRENSPLDAAARSLSRRPAPPQHYSQAWIDIALGTALWAQGKADQAQPLLTRGLFVGNQLDHPLTAWGLIVLGRMALDADQAPQAAKLFEEATYTAADYGDMRALEEAFQLAWTAHRMAGTPGVAPSISAAADWARGGPPVLRARLLAMQAESFAVAGNPRAAANALKGIDGRLLKGDAGRGTLGSLAAYASAVMAYAGDDVAGGDGELERAISIARSRSLKLFRLDLLVELLKAGSSAVSDRQADGWFSSWLADPRPRDLALDPLDTLAVMSSPREAAFDAWVAVAGRRGNEQILEAAEATMRNRWLSARPLGGRRIAVQRFLAADPRTLEPAEAARRAALVAGQQGLDALLTRTAQLRGSLEAAAAADPAADPLRDMAGEWQEYAGLATRGQAVVAALAAGRNATPPLFPPLTPSPEIRRRLEPGQALLSFHWTAAGLFGALEFRDRLLTWQIRQSAGLPGELKVLAKSLLLSDKAAAVPADRLGAGDWQGSVARIERMLFENSRGVSLAGGIEELVIVPDGWLWYLPFELLPVATNQAGGDRRPLRDVCRIRYAPTRSLAVMRFEPRQPGTTGVLVGRLNRGEKEPEVAAAVGRLTAGVAGAVQVEVPAAGPSAALVGSLFDTLLVYDESTTADSPAAATLLAAGQGRSGLSLAEWLAPPSKRPQRVIVPGLQSAMGGGLSKPLARPGQDVFLTVTDLLAAGSTTALVTRWRSGGGVAGDLVQEFLRETAGPGGISAVEAWQRAVDIVTPERPDLETEPRIKPAAGTDLADARHPLFWAGFLLVDVGGGVYEEPAGGVPPPPPLAPAMPIPQAPRIAGPGAPAPAPPAPPGPGGPMPPAILEPPPPRPNP